MKEIQNKKDNIKKEVVSDLCLLCDAHCCKENFVPLTDEEIKSKKYEMIFVTIFNFENKKLYSGYFLKRKKDGSCIYLNELNMCSIWKARPLSCRIFICDKLKKS